ncbi:serine/threonine-protein kinase [Salinactinospora qingdaonensis]|uniref:Protein kinase domain-containing protein n=1 Tax=Salinactinospora qingdaonensis TaxID=702744 RepID=A0ABP7EYD9_9ACTN
MIARGPRRLQRLRPDDPRTVGAYDIVGRIGSGGMGTVYAGTTDELSGYIAIKVVHGEHAANQEFRKRFAREAKLMARVDSPCLARFIHADVEAELPWLATEFVPGPTLRHYVERHQPLRGGMLLGLAAGTAEALRSIHAAGIVHRDLKPSNIILAPEAPKLLDFGIAYADEDPTWWLRVRRVYRGARERRVSPPRVPSQSSKSGSGGGDRVGTPGWISPEQYQRKAVSDRSDIFLWGALVGFAAARHDPFGHGPPKEMARRVLHEQPDLQGLPPQLKELVLAAMAKNPDDRPSSKEVLQRVLELAEPGEEAPAGDRQRLRALLSREWTRVSDRLPKPPRPALREILTSRREQP